VAQSSHRTGVLKPCGRLVLVLFLSTMFSVYYNISLPFAEVPEYICRSELQYCAECHPLNSGL
jgi:hypothetical protein